MHRKMVKAGLRDSSREEMLHRSSRKRPNLRLQKRIAYLKWLSETRRDIFRNPEAPFRFEKGKTADP